MQVNCEFIFSVDSYQVIHDFLLIGEDRTRTSSNRFARKIEVLADMTDINQDSFVGDHAVAPLSPIENRGPDENDC